MTQAAEAVQPQAPRREVIYRHPAWVRVAHWVNALCLLVLLLSGLQIFNAHPALYWGRSSPFDRPFISLEAREAGPGKLAGVSRIGGLSLPTTGVLGVSKGEDGQPEVRGFPKWLTLPGYRDLATGRRWHFLFAWLFVVNGAAYLALLLFGRRLRTVLWPTAKDLRGVGASIWEHVRLRRAKGEAARSYNVLQKLSYLAVIFLLLPLMVLSGMTMSPGLDTVFPGLLWVFGGRQSARTIHFLTASAVVLFFLVHVFEVFAAGFWNEMRSIVTGRYAVDVEGPKE